ncbi:MAG: hypothetical protein CMC70_02675 [Flavobacteriaceae bacterium]|nr:hypothetical protein [Flavobacteriaceae bacterium]
MNFNVSWAQTTYECGFEVAPQIPEMEWYCDSQFSKSTDHAYLDTFGPVVINIHFWRIVYDNGSAHTNHITENDVLLAISEINRELNQYNIFFKYRGFKDIPITEIYIPLKPAYLTSFINSYNGPLEVKKPDAFNMYVPYDYQESYGGSATMFGRMSQVKRENFYKSEILHELGHNLGLLHPFYAFQENAVETCEHVTRNPLDPYYNADTHGDRITDTAATNVLRAYNTNEFTCEYEGNDKDCEETDYDIFQNDVRNFMNYVPQDDLSCDKMFSIGQGIRMREALDIDCSSQYANAFTTVAALYEPYKGEYFLAGPSYPSIYTPYFQPGFDYEFVECCCNYPQPADYYDMSFSFNPLNVVKHIPDDETDYSSIYHPNHTAIVIEEVDLSLGYTYARKCYDNNNRNPKGGSVIRFNDGVFNANVTITPQDSTAINSPNLINNLDQGLYKIEKEYNDGSTQETVIYKEND